MGVPSSLTPSSAWSTASESPVSEEAAEPEELAEEPLPKLPLLPDPPLPELPEEDLPLLLVPFSNDAMELRRLFVEAAPVFCSAAVDAAVALLFSAQEKRPNAPSNATAIHAPFKRGIPRSRQ